MEPELQFVPSLGGSFYVRWVPVVKKSQQPETSELIAPGRRREMVWKEYQWSTTANGPWTFLSVVPMGLDVVEDIVQ